MKCRPLVGLHVGNDGLAVARRSRAFAPSGIRLGQAQAILAERLAQGAPTEAVYRLPHFEHCGGRWRIHSWRDHPNYRRSRAALEESAWLDAADARARLSDLLRRKYDGMTSDPGLAVAVQGRLAAALDREKRWQRERADMRRHVDRLRRVAELAADKARPLVADARRANYQLASKVRALNLARTNAAGAAEITRARQERDRAVALSQKAAEARRLAVGKQRATADALVVASRDLSGVQTGLAGLAEEILYYRLVLGAIDSDLP